MTQKIVTRFAPSPTGFLHIGSARTALFNYLFARKNEGKFLLRIEDTDKARSTDESIQAIISGLKWLGLEWDDDIIFQSKRLERHIEEAHKLLASENAYLCFESSESIDKARDEALSKGEPFIFKSPWRDAVKSSYPKGIKPVLRMKAPRFGSTIIKDTVQGDVQVLNAHLDDMVLLRSDGLPTYMLAVVVDDIDMGITHIIRGDDHLTNAARQILLYNAFSKPSPNMTHIPLIHSQDGHKLSKRHGAIGVESYKAMGYLPEALFSYLLKLGWSHGNDDIITKEQALAWFDLEHLGASPSRLDFAKMKQINSYYLHSKSDEEILEIMLEEYKLQGYLITENEKIILRKSVPHLKIRAELTNDLPNLGEIFLVDNIDYTISKQATNLINKFDKEMLQELVTLIFSIEVFDKTLFLTAAKNFAKMYSLKISDLMLIIRILITGKEFGVGVLDIMEIMGKENIFKKVECAWLKLN